MSDKPPIGRYLVAGGLALAGVAIGAGLVLRAVVASPEPVRFLIPGAATVHVARPGRQVIWHEHRTLFEGRTYDAAPQLPPGIELRVTDPAGHALGVRPSGGASWKSGARERSSVAEFDAQSPGPHALTAQGRFAPRVLAVGPSMIGSIVLAAAGAIAAVVIGFGAALALGLHAFLRQVAQAPAAEASAGEARLRQLAAVVYGLQAAALLFGITLIAGAMVNYLKGTEVAGSWLEAHFRWQIRTFWWTLLWTAIGFATAIAGVGVLVLLATAVWFVCRVAKGWIRLNEGRPI